VSPGKIRAAVVAEKAAAVRRMMSGIATLPLGTESAFHADPRMVAAGESYLRRALEALFDIGRHLLAKGFGEPASEYREIARRLGELTVLDRAAAQRMERMAGYRNRLVHFYDEVTPAELYRILTIHVGELEELVDCLRAWLQAHPELRDDSL
jgi:uncharacterized protein YutE (UPF0331/DUF86 family)